MKRRGFLEGLIAAFAAPLAWAAPVVTAGRRLLLNRSAASAPENQLVLPDEANVELRPNETVLLHYRNGQWVAEYPQT